MELWLPPTPCRGAPSSCSTCSRYVYFMRAMVQVRRVRWGQPPDPVPSVLFKAAYASSSSTCSGACWWIPAGGEVLLCGHFCRQCLSNAPCRVPRCLKWVRHSLDNLGQGPAGGRQLALRVSPSVCDSTFARCRFSSFARYGVARCSWGVCVGSFCWSRASPCGSPGGLLGVPCPLLPCQFHLLCFLGASSDDKWCSAARVAETAMSGVVPSSLGSNSSQKL